MEPKARVSNGLPRQLDWNQYRLTIANNEFRVGGARLWPQLARASELHDVTVCNERHTKSERAERAPPRKGTIPSIIPQQLPVKSTRRNRVATINKQPHRGMPPKLRNVCCQIITALFPAMWLTTHRSGFPGLLLIDGAP